MLRIEVTTPECAEDEAHVFELEWFELKDFFASLHFHYPDLTEVKITRIEDDEVHP